MDRSRLFILLALFAAILLHHWRHTRASIAENTTQATEISATHATSTTAPAKASAVTAPTEDARKAFARMTSHALNTMATVAVIQDHPEASFEFPPKELLQSSESLGRIAEALKEEPALAPEGMAFYATCAKREDLLTAVRAVCLHDLRLLARRSKLTPDDSLAALPKSLQHLADKLPQ